MEKIVLGDKFELFTEQWSPRIVAELNDNHILLARLKGEFVWHKHDYEDELFLVVKGKLVIRFREGRQVELAAGELLVVPAGVEHLPVAEDEVYVMLVEPKVTKHTGETTTERTVTTYQRI